MMRTLHLAGVHGWVSFRLSVRRHYWLPRLSLALIAGYTLLFFSRHFNPAEWGPVWTCAIMGASCFPVGRSETNSALLPLPLPRSWQIVASTFGQLMVCVVVAVGFMLIDMATAYAVLLETAHVEPSKQPISHLLTATELKSMAFITAASLPFGIATVAFRSHFENTSNQLPNRRALDVLPFWFLVTAALGAGWFLATAFQAPAFVVNYLLMSAFPPAFIAVISTFTFTLLALFPPSEAQVRIAKPAIQRLTITVWKSQAIKWTILLAGLALYLVPPTVYLSDGWLSKFILRMRPILICYAAGFPILTGMLNTIMFSTVGNRQYIGWRWKGSGWRGVPIPRATIQRTLFFNIFGFAALSTVTLHVVSMLAVQFTAGTDALNQPMLVAKAMEGTVPLESWVQELRAFTWFYIMFMGTILPTCVLFFIPRRRFGVVLSITAIAGTFWGVRNGFYGMDLDIAWTLPLKQHLITVGFWAAMGAILWGQSASSSGRLFEGEALAKRGLGPLGTFLGARGTRWVAGIGALITMIAGLIAHRQAMTTEADRLYAAQITTEQTDRLVADLESIAELGVLTRPTRSRDAGPLINPHLGLDDGTDAEVAPWWTHKPRTQALKPSKVQPWYDAPDTIMNIGDLTLLTDLTVFDHWESGPLPTKDEPPIGRYAQRLYDNRSRTYLNHGEPFPNLVPLMNLSKYRLIQGLRDGDILTALAEVRHLATLVYSDETLVHSLTAVGILRAERRAYTAAVKRGLIAPTDWPVISESDLNRMHRAAVSMAYVMAGGAGETEWRRIANLAFEPFGLCGAIHDAVTSALSRPSITLWPGERFPEPRKDFLDHALSTSHCQLPLARYDHPFIDRDDTSRNRVWHRTLSEDLDDTTLLTLTIPYLRGHAWKETRDGQSPFGILMYGDTPDGDWNGARVIHKGGKTPKPQR